MRTAAHDRVDRALLQLHAGADGAVAHLEERALRNVDRLGPIGGEDEVGARRREVHRLDELLAGHGRLLRRRTDADRALPADDRRALIRHRPPPAVPRVEALAAPEVGRGRADPHHEGVIRTAADGGVHRLGETEVAERGRGAVAARPAAARRVLIAEGRIRQPAQLWHGRRVGQTRGERQEPAGLGRRRDEEDPGGRHECEPEGGHGDAESRPRA